MPELRGKVIRYAWRYLPLIRRGMIYLKHLARGALQRWGVLRVNVVATSVSSERTYINEKWYGKMVQRG